MPTSPTATTIPIHRQTTTTNNKPKPSIDMLNGEVKQLLTEIGDDGYADWVVHMCDEDNNDFTVRLIGIDEEGDLCLCSLQGDKHDFTSAEILKILKWFPDSMDVYILQEDDDELFYYEIDNDWGTMGLFSKRLYLSCRSSGEEEE